MTQAVPAPAGDATDVSVRLEDDRPLPPVVAAFSVILFTAISVLCALIEVTLVPLRHGTTVVPVTVLLAIISNIAVPTLSRRAVPLTVAALFPALAWVLTVILLSQARPEGDLLLIGTAPLVDVTYALLGLGLASGLGTVIRGQHAGLAQRREPRPTDTAAGASAVGRGTAQISSRPSVQPTVTPRKGRSKRR